MKKLMTIGLVWIVMSIAFEARARDLLSADDVQKACTRVGIKMNMIKNDQDRLIFVLCNDFNLARILIRVGAEVPEYMEEYQQGVRGGRQAAFRKKAEEILDGIKISRAELEKVNLKNGEGFKVRPGHWGQDWNGDGKIETWEKYLLAIPKKGESQELLLRMQSNDMQMYKDEYDLDATFKVDQSDVLWILAYHQFLEGALELIMAFELIEDRRKAGQFGYIKLVEPQRLRQAHAHILNGLITSRKLYQSILTETDDNKEWIAHPRQKSSTFPIALTKHDFKLWQEFLSYLIPLWKGETILNTSSQGLNVLIPTSEVCPNGQGFNIKSMFYISEYYPMTLFMDRKQGTPLQQYCAKPSDKIPYSDFDKFIGKYAGELEWDGLMQSSFLMRLIWIN